MAPADALTADGLSGAWRCVGNRTPCTPAASALRSSVPTLCGSSSESRTRMNGGSPRSAARARTSSRLANWRGSTTSATPWWPSKPGERRQRPALDLDDRDPQVRGMQHELLEGGPALGDDEQPDGGTTRDERLLDRAAAGDELLVGTEGLRRRQRRRSRRAAVASARTADRRYGRSRARATVGRVDPARAAPPGGPVVRPPARRSAGARSVVRPVAGGSAVGRWPGRAGPPIVGRHGSSRGRSGRSSRLDRPPAWPRTRSESVGRPGREPPRSGGGQGRATGPVDRPDHAGRAGAMAGIGPAARAGRRSPLERAWPARSAVRSWPGVVAARPIRGGPP